MWTLLTVAAEADVTITNQGTNVTFGTYPEPQKEDIQVQARYTNELEGRIIKCIVTAAGSAPNHWVQSSVRVLIQT